MLLIPDNFKIEDKRCDFECNGLDPLLKNNLEEKLEIILTNIYIYTYIKCKREVLHRKYLFILIRV